MKMRKNFWFPITVVLGFVVYFDIELIHYILASREMDRRSIWRFQATLFISEYAHLRKEVSGAAARYVTTRDAGFKAEFLDKIAMQDCLMSCKRIPDKDGWSRIYLDPTLTFDRNEILFRSVSDARFLAVEVSTLEQLIKVSGQLGQMEREAVEAASSLSGNAYAAPADWTGLASESYLQLNTKSDILIKDLKDLILKGNWQSRRFASDDAAGHLRWVFRLGLVQAGLLIGLVWLGKVRLTRVERRAFHDALTDLPNRLHLDMYLKWVCSRAEAHGEAVILAFIDLNGFKPINDILGHDSGDYILRYVADQLMENCRSNDMASRFGGDEFVVVFVSPANLCDQSLQRLRNLLHATFDEPCEFGRELGFGAAVGISVFPSRATSLEDLIGTADRAMYQAKKLAHDSKEYLTIVEYQKALSEDGIPFDLSGSRW